MSQQKEQKEGAGARTPAPSSDPAFSDVQTAETLAQPALENHHPAALPWPTPRLGLTLDRQGRLWATISDVDCKYCIEVADLDAPCYVAARIACFYARSSS
jgi:hypothetical protein